MVRFARAKGSKASNERLPENATPWHVMKDQLEEKKQIKKEIEESKELSKKSEEKSEPFYPQTLNTNAEWAEFENAPVKKEIVEKKKKLKPKPGKESGKKNANHNGERNKRVQQNDEQNGEAGKPKLPPGVMTVSTKRRLRRERLAWKKTGEPKPEDSEEPKNENSEPAEKKIKLQVESKDAEAVTETCAGNENNSVENENPSGNENPPAQKLSQSAKRRLKKKRKLEEKQLSGEIDTTATFLTKRQKRNLKDKTKKTNAGESNASEANTEMETEVKTEENNFQANGQEPAIWNGPPKKVPRHNHLTPAKPRDDRPHARRKPEHGAMKIILHGEEVEVVRFEGFPMRKEDAERLKELRKELIMKGVPKPEVEKAMKMERRKAEKILSRIKKLVCFLCRKSGHNLSDCPNLDKEQSATGICFKCGSTEHTHFECKTNKTDDYKFASCFICRERGHIAKQCPDNPKGVYPDGGCCNVCGDVTHLRKDCPELIQKKEEATLTVQTISNDLESLDEDLQKKNNSEDKTKPKLVKF